MDWWLYVAFMLINALICPISVCEPRSPTLWPFFNECTKHCIAGPPSKPLIPMQLAKGALCLETSSIICPIGNRSTNYKYENHTSTVLVAQVWKSPDISEPNGKTEKTGFLWFSKHWLLESWYIRYQAIVTQYWVCCVNVYTFAG